MLAIVISHFTGTIHTPFLVLLWVSRSYNTIFKEAQAGGCMNRQNKHELGFLFNVDILVRNKTNAKALQSLLQLLNSGDDIIDYRVKSGIELGEIIDASLSAKRRSLISKSNNQAVVNNNGNSENNSEESTPSLSVSTPCSNDILAPPMQMIQDWMETNMNNKRLVRLTILHNNQRLNIPCRILIFNEESQMVSVYHVDEKQVYTFHLNEIIDYVEA